MILTSNLGKYMNDLGDYEGCENISGLHYATIQIKVQAFSSYIGL